jgi:hypothetical protein
MDTGRALSTFSLQNPTLGVRGALLAYTKAGYTLDKSVGIYSQITMQLGKAEINGPRKTLKRSR